MFTTNSSRTIILVLSVLILISSSLSAQTHTWNSAVSGNWSTAALWNPAAVPTNAVDDVLIAAVGTNYTVTYNSASTTISQLTINSANATFAMTSGTLNVTNFNLQNGSWTMSGSAVLNGTTINMTGGTATLNGGTISNATILTTAGLRLTNTGTSTTLTNVVLGNGANADVLNLSTGSWNFVGTTDFQAGFVPTLSNSAINYRSTISLATDFNLGSSSALRSDTSGNTVTIGVGRTITSTSNTSVQLLGAGNWQNNGTIQVSGNGSSLSISNSGSFTNNGTILTQSSGASQAFVTIFNSVSSFTNNGTLRSASANSFLTLQEDVTTAQLGNWDTTGGGEVRLNNILNNAGNTLDLTVTRGNLFLNNATINGGTVQTAAGLRLQFTSGSGSAATLNNVILGGANGNLDVLKLDAGGTWSFQGTTDFQAGFSPTLSNATSIAFLTSRTLTTDFTLQNGNLQSATGQTTTIDVGRTLSRTTSGSGGQIQGSGNWVNNGTIQVSGNGSSLSISNSGSFTNNGTILTQSSGASQAFVTIFNSVSSFTNNGTLRSASANSFLTLQEDVTTAQLGNWDTTGGGEVRLNNILNNAGNTLDLTVTRGNLFLNNATINGGTVQTAAGLRLQFTSGSGSAATLNNVILGGANGNLDVLKLDAGGTWSFQGTTDFQTGFVPTLTNTTRLNYLNTRTLNTDFVLQNGTIESSTAGQTITVGIGRTISITPGGASNLQGSGNWINNGTIRTTGNGTSFSISNTGSFSNQGSIIAESNGATQTTFSLTPTTLTNYNAGTFTLTDGTYQALTRGTITSGSREFRNLSGNAQIELGLNSSFPAVEGKLTTVGSNASFIISGGKTFSVTNSTSTFSNNGLVRVTGTGSTLTIGAGINLTNYNVGTQTLTGGVFEVINGGSLNLGARTTNIIQSGTRVVLNGSNANFSVIEGGLLTTLNGQLNVNNGKTLTIASGGLTITGGGVLSGHLGTINGGTVRVTTTGTIAPGNSPGQITIGGGLDIGGNLELDISQGGNNNSNSQGNTTPGNGFDTIAVQPPPSTNPTIRTNANIRLVSSNVNMTSAFWSTQQKWLFIRTTSGQFEFSNGLAGDTVVPLSALPDPNVSIIDASNGSPIDFLATWPTAKFEYEVLPYGLGQDLNVVWTPVPEPCWLLFIGFSFLLILKRKLLS